MKAIILFIAFISFYSCNDRNEILSPYPDTEDKKPQKDDLSDEDIAQLFSTVPCGDVLQEDLIAGQHYLAGTVSIFNDEDSLYIVLSAADDWFFNETHLYVGDFSGLPTNPSGNPQIGQFPYNTTHQPSINFYSWAIDLGTLDSCFIIALHAEIFLVDSNGDVIQSETGWLNGTDINNGGSWATMYTYCVQSCCEIDEVLFDIYAGQNILVGDLIVINDADSIYVTYNLDSCWELSETQLFVGDLDDLPVNGQNVPIPGQFPYKDTHTGQLSSFSYAIPLAGLDSCFVIAAHSTVNNYCNFPNGGGEETGWSFGDPFPNTNRWGWTSPYCRQSCE